MAFEFDFTDVKEASTVYRGIPETGLYRVKVISVSQRTTQAGNERIEFDMEVDSGEHKGCSVRTGLNIVTRAQCADAREYNYKMKFWKTAFVSFGVKKLDGKIKGEGSVLDYCRKHCEGKVGYLAFEKGDPYDQKDLITPDEYNYRTKYLEPAKTTEPEQKASLNITSFANHDDTESEEASGSEDPLDFIPF